MTKPGALTRCHQTVIDIDPVAGRHVELVAELAEIRDADAENRHRVDIDLPRRPERKTLIGEVGRRIASTPGRGVPGC